MAFIVAAVGHEAVGHGGACLALGGRITLLTSVYFRCSDGRPLVDAAGSLMNLILGAACWRLARWRPAASPSRTFFVLAMAFNLFWGAGYFVFSAVTDGGDWAFVLRGLALEPRWMWRVLMGGLGVYLYVRFVRAVASNAPAGLPLAIPWLVVGAVSCAAVLLYPGPALPALREAAQESLGAACGLLVLGRSMPARSAGGASGGPAVLGAAGLILSGLVTVLFFLIFGRGAVLPPAPFL